MFSKHLAMKVKCPECGTVYTVPQGTPDVACNCHLICPDGTIPRDCSMTEFNYSGSLGWPARINLNHENLSNDILHATFYCSTHDRYSHKVPIVIELDWVKWYSQRAPKNLRMSHGEY